MIIISNTMNNIRLVEMSDAMYHSFFQEYENDLDLYLDPTQYTHYQYSKEAVDKYILKQHTLHRIPLAIMHGKDIVGEILLKNITSESATLSIVLKNSTYKGLGYGTKAERLVIEYAFNVLGVSTLLADTIITNTCSQHVLEKVGFMLVSEDEQFRYYRISRE